MGNWHMIMVRNNQYYQSKAPIATSEPLASFGILASLLISKPTCSITLIYVLPDSHLIRKESSIISESYPLLFEMLTMFFGFL
jgi:hypothetical protein